MTLVPAGTSTLAPWALWITPETAGWNHAGLRLLTLSDESVLFCTGDEEMLVLPLSGSCRIECDGVRLALEGRVSVFHAVSDFAYLPVGATVRITGAGRFAFPTARASRSFPVRYGPAREVPVEVRGEGRTSSQINGFCAPGAFECDRLVAVEVLTPGGNRTPCPPYEHDATPECGAVRERIYYFEGGPGYQRIHGAHETVTEVSSGDVVLVPHGCHGPSTAAPGHDLYHLSVLAGPERPAAATEIRAHGQAPDDPRLPMTKAP
ncbi:5-deoxy-glucuronate isomerase [Streptosporangium sp. NPDC020072]|uniref:5-deoxy-glucuronate isomerase n=1 Tax=Streptosporangium jomthongense TaxID=1193683 RepID=A0ABV8FDG4_9ACTN